LIILGLLIISWIITAIFEYKPHNGVEEGLGGELGSLALLAGDELQAEINDQFIPADCTDSELMKIWDYIFQDNPGQSNLVFVSNKDANNNCSEYLVYNISGGNIGYLLYGRFENRNDQYSHTAMGIYGNFTDSMLLQIENTGGYYLEELFEDLVLNSQNFQGNREISNESEANIEYHRIFRLSNDSWQFGEDSYSGGHYFFYSLDTIEDPNYENHTTGSIIINKTFDWVMYGERYTKAINLTQVKNIEYIELYGSKLHTNRINLDVYFKNLGEDYENLSIGYGASIPNSITIQKSDYFWVTYLDIDASSGFGGLVYVNITLGYPGLENVTSNNFPVFVNNCSDPDYLSYSQRTKTFTWNATANGTDYCLSNSQVMEYQCDYYANVISYPRSCGSGYYCTDGACIINTSVNHAPDFKGNVCGDIYININNTLTYVLNLSKCFEDDDGDSMVFRFNNASMKNVSLVRNDTKITLTARTGFLGNEYFYIYANDSELETGGKVNVHVNNFTGGNIIINQTNQSVPPQTPLANETKIISSNPLAGTYNLFTGEGKNFSINPQNYTSIQWFLDDALVASNVTMYQTGSLDDGTHVVRVQINGPTGLDSKTWTILVGDEEISESVSIGKVIFWSIVAVIIIIILLVIWLFIAEKNKKPSGEINTGFGVSVKSETNVGKPLKSGVYKTP